MFSIHRDKLRQKWMKRKGFKDPHSQRIMEISHTQKKIDEYICIYISYIYTFYIRIYNMYIYYIYLHIQNSNHTPNLNLTNMKHNTITNPKLKFNPHSKANPSQS